MSMTETLYVTSLSPFGARVRMALALTGQSLAEAPPPGGAGSEEMKAISHFGKMPAITTGEAVLVESVALLEYVADRDGGSSLRPEDIIERARMRSIMLAFDNHVLIAIWPMFVQLRSGRPDPAMVLPALDAAKVQSEVLARLLDDDQGFAVGGCVSLADLAMAPFALLFGRVYPAFGSVSPFEDNARLAGWWSTVRAVPEIAGIVEKMDAAFTSAFGGR
jgi:glutathione S-transferase